MADAENERSLDFLKNSGEHGVMSHAESHRELLDAWKAGDQDAASILFHRYQLRLIALVRSRLARKLARRIDPEDIVLSAYRSFFVSARNGRISVNAEDDLWPLLVTIVLRKVAKQARHHSAEQRSVERERPQASDWVEHLVGAGETEAEHAAILEDEVENLLALLDATARDVLVQTLQGHDTASIAASIGISERSVRRALDRIRSLLPITQDDFGVVPVARPSRTVRLPTPAIPASVRIPLVGTMTHEQFLLEEFLGAGAFSKVYRAIDRSSGNPVAVKYLRKDCWHDDRVRGSLIREYEVLQRLNHPNIIRMHAWGTTSRGAVFLVEEYVRGQNLNEWRHTANPTTAQLVEAVCTVAKAISAAHSGGVIHCDLTPTNILRRDDGHIIVCDFGMARYASSSDEIPHGGTAGFLCPEQISDAFGVVAERSDVYGLGGLLYALLTGTPPQQGRDLPETLSNVLSSRPPLPVSRPGTHCSPLLESVIQRCLQKEPTDRFASAGEVAAALEGLDLPE